MRWHGGTHELRRRIWKLLEQIKFQEWKYFYSTPVTVYMGSNLLHLLELLLFYLHIGSQPLPHGRRTWRCPVRDLSGGAR
jgi:hypothetical protein